MKFLTESEQECLVWIFERGGITKQMKNEGWLCKGEILPFQHSTLYRLSRRGLLNRSTKCYETSAKGARLAEILQESKTWI